MIRFALIAASTLGFFLTAALGNLMVPLLRAFQGRWDEPKARQAPSPKQETPEEELERPSQTPTIRQSPPIVGGSFSSCRTRNARSSGVIKFPSAAVRTNPSVEATIKAKRIIITILQVFYFVQTG